MKFFRLRILGLVWLGMVGVLFFSPPAELAYREALRRTKIPEAIEIVNRFLRFHSILYLKEHNIPVTEENINSILKNQERLEGMDPGIRNIIIWVLNSFKNLSVMTWENNFKITREIMDLEKCFSVIKVKDLDSFYKFFRDVFPILIEAGVVNEVNFCQFAKEFIDMVVDLCIRIEPYSDVSLETFYSTFRGFAEADILTQANFFKVCRQLFDFREKIATSGVNDRDACKELFGHILPVLAKKCILTETNLEQIIIDLLNLVKDCSDIGFEPEYLFKTPFSYLTSAGMLKDKNLLQIGKQLIELGKNLKEYGVDYKYLFENTLPSLINARIIIATDIAKISYISQPLFLEIAEGGILFEINIHQIGDKLLIIAKECSEAGFNPEYLFNFILPVLAEAGNLTADDMLEVSRGLIKLDKVCENIAEEQRVALFTNLIPERIKEGVLNHSNFYLVLEFTVALINNLGSELNIGQLFDSRILSNITTKLNIFAKDYLSETVTFIKVWTEYGFQFLDLLINVLPCLVECDILTEDNIFEVGTQLINLGEICESLKVDSTYFYQDVLPALVKLSILENSIFEIGKRAIEITLRCKNKRFDPDILFKFILPAYDARGMLTEKNLEQIADGIIDLYESYLFSPRSLLNRDAYTAVFFKYFIPSLIKTGILTDKNDLGVATDCRDIKFSPHKLCDYTIPVLVQKGILNESNVVEVSNELIQLGNSSKYAGFEPDDIFEFTIPALVKADILNRDNFSLLCSQLLVVGNAYYAAVNEEKASIAEERRVFGEFYPEDIDFPSIFQELFPQLIESGKLDRHNISMYFQLIKIAYEIKSSSNIFQAYGIEELVQRALKATDNSGVISSGYIPDLYILGELEREYPKRYGQLVNGWVFGGLLKAEVEGYLRFYFEKEFPQTRDYITTSIKNPIRRMAREEIENILLGKCDNPISANQYRVAETLVKSLDASQLEEFFINREIDYYIFGPQEENSKTDFQKMVAKQMQICMDVIKEEVEHLLWLNVGNGQRLKDSIGLAEAEYITRQVAEILLRGTVSAGKQISDFFDAESSKSTEANRWCYFSIPHILEDLTKREKELLADVDKVMQIIDNWSALGNPSAKLAEALDYLWPGFSSIEVRRRQLKGIVGYNPALAQIIFRLDTALKPPAQKPDISREDLLKLAEEIVAFNRIYSLASIVALGNATDTSEPEKSEAFLSDPVGYAEKTEGFYLSSFMQFYRDVVCADIEINLAYFTDNNGEVIFDLLFIRELLRMNPELKITIVPKSVHIGNDVSFDTLQNDILGDLDRNNFDYFRDIRAGDRVTIVNSGTVLQGVDFRDPELQKIVASADVVLFKGQGNFKTSQGLNKPRYHIFMVKSEAVEEATGLFGPAKGALDLGPLIFCYIEPGISVGKGAGNKRTAVEIPNAEEMNRAGELGNTAAYTLWDYYLEYPEYYDPR